MGEENLLDIGSKGRAIDGTVEQPWRVDPVVAERCQEGGGLPVAVRDLGGEPHAALRPSPQRRHVGLGPGLVDEDQALGSDAVLILDPLPPSASNVRPVALAGDDAFF